MKKIIKRVLLGLAVAIALLAATVAIYVAIKTSEFDASMDKVYDVPLPSVVRSTDPAVLARGEHLAKSVAPCATRDCHGSDLGGGKPIVMGPLATITGPNISAAGLGATYSDAELVRLIKHGIKKDGRSLRFMPAQDFAWLPDADVVAIVSYLRTMPAVDKPNGQIEIKVLGKVLDRRDGVPLDVARRIDHAKSENAPAPQPTAEYGQFVGRLCTGCHGPGLTGGRLPGAPSDIPIPLNLTPHETGMKGWTYEEFDKLLSTGIRKNGQKVAAFMPYEAFNNFDDTERHALFAYLQSLPPAPFGNR